MDSVDSTASYCDSEPPSNLLILSPDDVREYLSLRAGFHDEFGKSKKGERLDTFMDQLKRIRKFVERADDSDNWKRSVVCGIFFLADGFAINIQQLRLLLGRCKSSINGSLQRLHCAVEMPGQSVHPELLARIPASYREGNELKKWTIRRGAVAIMESSFVIPLPAKWTAPVTVAQDPFWTPSWRNLPCPVKCRYKYYDMLCQSVPLQIEGRN
jgi:hypothetical protein